MRATKTPRTLNRSDAAKLARIRLLEKHDFYKSWAAVKDETGINKGLACAIASGRRQPSDRVLATLKIEYTRTAPAPCCPRCGVPHVTKRCTRRPTFDERAAQYDAWLARNTARIAAIVARAEGGER